MDSGQASVGKCHFDQCAGRLEAVVEIRPWRVRVGPNLEPFPQTKFEA